MWKKWSMINLGPFREHFEQYFHCINGHFIDILRPKHLCRHTQPELQFLFNFSTKKVLCDKKLKNDRFSSLIPTAVIQSTNPRLHYPLQPNKPKFVLSLRCTLAWFCALVFPFFVWFDYKIAFRSAKNFNKLMMKCIA